MRLKLALIFVLAAAAAAPVAAEDAFAGGLKLFNEGEWTKAAASLVSAAARSPNDVVARLTAGVALANVRLYTEALEQFKAASNLLPQDPLPQLLLDGTYSELGNAPLSRRARSEANRVLYSKGGFGESRGSDEALRASLEKYPQNAIAHCLLGDVYQLQGNRALAKEHYDKSSKLAPKWAKPVFNAGLADLDSDPKAAEERFGQVIEMDPSNSRAYLWQGDAYLRQNRYSDAVEAYNNAAKDEAVAAEARTRLGNAQMQAGNLKAASKQFDIAAQQAPEDPRPLVGKAKVLQTEGQLEEAQEAYQQAAGVMSKNDANPASQALVQSQMAAVNVEMGQYDDAASNFQTGFTLHPTKDAAEALVISQQKANLLGKAIEDNEAALHNNPNDKQAMLYLLSAYKLKRNYIGCIDMAGRLVKADPANAWTYHAEAGAAWMSLNKPENAVAEYTRALELGSPATWSETADSARASGALGLVREEYDATFAASGKARDGIVLFDLQCAQGDVRGMVNTGLDLVQAHPDEPTLWLRLGEAYGRVGKTDLARVAYSKAASMSNPEAASAARARLRAIGADAGKGAK